MKSIAEMDMVFTPEEVAKSLKVTGGTIRNLIRKGKIFAFQVGDQYRIPDYALNQWLSPFSGVDWESLGFGMWKADEKTKDPVRYLQKLRKTKHRSIRDYLSSLDPEPSK